MPDDGGWGEGDDLYHHIPVSVERKSIDSGMIIFHLSYILIPHTTPPYTPHYTQGSFEVWSARCEFDRGFGKRKTFETSRGVSKVFRTGKWDENPTGLTTASDSSADEVDEMDEDVADDPGHGILTRVGLGIFPRVLGSSLAVLIQMMEKCRDILLFESKPDSAIDARP